MKRTLLFTFAVLFSVAAFAEKPIRVVSGSTKFFKQASGYMEVEILWDQTQWKDGRRMMEELDPEKFEDYVSRAEFNFMDGFNSKRSNIKASTTEFGRYHMIVDVTKVDHFYSVTSIIPGNKHTVWATITVIDNQTKQEVCVIEVTRLKGGRDFGIDDSFSKCFFALGENIAEL